MNRKPMSKNPLLNKRIYRIRHAVTGLYKKAGQFNSWGKQGKVWVGSGPLKSHMNQYATTDYKTGQVFFPADVHNWIIEEIEIKEEVITVKPALEIFQEKAKEMREKAEKAQRLKEEEIRKKNEALAKLTDADRKALGLKP